MSESQEEALGYQTQQATLSEYRGKILSPNHPLTRQVREVATRIIESAGLGKMTTGGGLGAVEGLFNEPKSGEIIFGANEGGPPDGITKDTEWEVVP
jgi:metalloendopeptidase OMA1, mitochondrial